MTEVAVTDPTALTTKDFKAITSFDEAVKLGEDTYGNVLDASQELGDGFAVLSTNDKGRLMNTPMFLVSWDFHKSDVGEAKEFVSIHAITKDGQKYIINDGSSGIYAQLREFTDEHDGRKGSFFVPRGLRESTYDYTDANGKTSKATTFYLNTAAAV